MSAASSNGLVMIDGTPCAPEEARVSVFDRGFLYGDSVFEALRTYGGKPFALEPHVARLVRSAELVRIPVPLAAPEFEREIAHAIELGGLPESYVRVLLTRGRAQRLGLASTLAGTALRVVMVLPLELPAEQKYTGGIAAITYAAPRLTDGTSAAGAKLGNYLVSVLATDAARSVGAEEALFLDAQRNVLEGATSNVFVVRGERLVTPPLSQDILAGITRRHVLDVAHELGIPVDERTVPLEELAHADEVFVSSSIRELLAITKVDATQIGSGRPGPVYARLLQAFRESARRLATLLP